MEIFSWEGGGDGESTLGWGWKEGGQFFGIFSLFKYVLVPHLLAVFVVFVSMRAEDMIYNGNV